MACAHTFKIPNPHYKPGTFFKGTMHKYFEVPCGWCLNCRIDKRNALEDRCNYAFNEFGCGSFVTLTYDNICIAENLRTNKKGELVATLCKKDAQDFFKRLRSRIDSYGSGTPYCNRKFKYVCVGEYGGNGQKFDRPHMHILFFGLDYQVCERLFNLCWKKGIVKSLPIKNGGIRYVLKYMDKQQHGTELKTLYDDNNIERPFCLKSNSLGVGLYTSQIDYIRSNNYCYKAKHNKNRPLPAYYKNKLLAFTVADNTYLRDKLRSLRIKPDNKGSDGGYSLEQMNNERKRLSAIREKNLIELARRDGQAVDLFVDSIKYNFNDLVNIAIDKAQYGDIIPF